MKSYGYKLINYIFSVAVYNLFPPLDQFVDAIPPKIPWSAIEEFVEPVFKVLFIVEGCRHHRLKGIHSRSDTSRTRARVYPFTTPDCCIA